MVFPVSYNDKFYKDVLEAGELAKLGKYLCSINRIKKPVTKIIALEFRF